MPRNAVPKLPTKKDGPYKYQNLDAIKEDYNKKLPVSLDYEVLTENVPVSSDKEIVAQKLTSAIRPTCRPTPETGTCDCCSEQGLGEYCVETNTFTSGCPDRAKIVECDDGCGCGTECLNRPISRGNPKQAGPPGSDKDILIQLTWGLDAYTRTNIALTLWHARKDWAQEKENGEEETPEEQEEEVNMFIDRTLLPALNQQPERDAYEMKGTLLNIIQKSAKAQNTRHMKMAQILKTAIKKMGTTEFWVHPKGKGAICNVPDGFKANEFIVEFLGEVYPPWRWYEIEEAIKKETNGLPVFYNITLERHKDDPSGYDMLCVDLATKGTFASRLSHSCTPNCSTHTVVTNGRYTIALYTTRPIAFGEELTIDYHCTTEKTKEYQQAICLCGTVDCRQSYLHCPSVFDHETAQRRYHNTCERVALLLQASTCTELCPGAEGCLKRHGFGESLLGGTPVWLRAFAALTLQHVENEREVLPGILLETNTDPTMAEAQAESIADDMRAGRIRNLAISIDKAKHFLQCQPEENRNQPPLRLLDPETIVDYLWTAKDSIMSQLLNSVKKVLSKPQYERLQALSKKPLPKTHTTALKAVRGHLRAARNIIISASKGTDSGLLSVADMLHLNACTVRFFTANKFNAVQPEPVSVLIDGVPKTVGIALQGTQYLWGQLHFWDRHTITEPTHSLSAARYGAVVLANVGSCINAGNREARASFLSKLLASPSMQWASKGWSFKASGGVYGTPMVDLAMGITSPSQYADILAEMFSWDSTRQPKGLATTVCAATHPQWASWPSIPFTVTEAASDPEQANNQALEDEVHTNGQMNGKNGTKSGKATTKSQKKSVATDEKNGVNGIDAREKRAPEAELAKAEEGDSANEFEDLALTRTRKFKLGRKEKKPQESNETNGIMNAETEREKKRGVSDTEENTKDEKVRPKRRKPQFRNYEEL